MLARAGILVALLVPSLAFAAYNDVTLTTDTVLSVTGITLNVSGSSATIESITVNATDFSVSLPSGLVVPGDGSRSESPLCEHTHRHCN